MEPEAPVVEVRRRRSRAEAEQLVAQYEASGVSQQEFCRRHGLSLAALARYRKRRRVPGEAAGAGRRLAVERSEAGPKVAGILSVVETCRRLNLPIRGYLGAALPRLARNSIQRLTELTPAPWAARNR